MNKEIMETFFNKILNKLLGESYETMAKKFPFFFNRKIGGVNY